MSYYADSTVYHPVFQLFKKQEKTSSNCDFGGMFYSFTNNNKNKYQPDLWKKSNCSGFKSEIGNVPFSDDGK